MKEIRTVHPAFPLCPLLPAMLALFLPLFSAGAQSLPEQMLRSLGTLPGSADEERFLIAPEGLGALLPAGTHGVVNGFPVAPGERSRVILRRTRPALDSRTRIVLGSANGEREVPSPEINCFSGVVPGENGSRIFVATTSGFTFCSITRGDGRSYLLGPSTNNAGEHLLLNQRDLKAHEPAPEFSCEAIPAPAPYPAASELPGAFVAAATLLQTEIAVEADYEYFLATGGTVDKATAYTAALFSMVSVLYEDEVNVTLHIPWFKVWTDSIADPYKVKGNAYALWDTVPRYWRNNYGDIPRHLAHVLTSVDYGGGGIAFRGEKFEGGAGALCSNLYGYGMSSPTGARKFPTFAFTYDAYIVAHELGHNFGARHTHDCWWNPPLDTCFTRDDATYKLDDACYALPVTPRPSSGSIMSYCQNTNYGMSGDFAHYKVEMTFLERVAEVMRQEAASACLTEPETPTLILKSPRGDRFYATDQNVEIRWASAGVERIRLEYSLDNGMAWSTIASDIPASGGTYLWRTPSMQSEQGLVRIVDAAHPDIADTSILPFAVAASAGHPEELPRISQLQVEVENGTIRIAYAPEQPPARVTIRLHDMQGKLIRNITDPARDGRGAAATVIPTSGIPSGTYLITIDADGTRMTRQCIISR